MYIFCQFKLFKVAEPLAQTLHANSYNRQICQKLIKHFKNTNLWNVAKCLTSILGWVVVSSISSLVSKHTKFVLSGMALKVFKEMWQHPIYYKPIPTLVVWVLFLNCNVVILISPHPLDCDLQQKVYFKKTNCFVNTCLCIRKVVKVMRT